MIAVALVVLACLAAPPVGWKAQLAWRKWKHARVLARTAQLERELGIASAEATSRPAPQGVPSYPPVWADTVVGRTNAEAFNVASAAEILGPARPEPPKKKPDRFVPVLDEEYFEQKAEREYAYYRPISVASIYGYGVYGRMSSASVMPFNASGYPDWRYHD